MNFKIINLPEFDADVCVRRDIDDSGNNIVVATVIFLASDGDEFFTENEEKFQKQYHAQAFVKGYNKADALALLREGIEEFNAEVNYDYKRW